MSEKEELGQPQRYCTNCGAQIRPGNAFCVSCGAPLTPDTGQAAPLDPGPEPSGRSVYPAGGFKEDSRAATGQVGGASSGLRAEDLRRVPIRVKRWFGRLPLAGKVALAALVLLALLTVLSPLTAVAAILAFCVSLVALIVRIGHGRSAARWGIAAVASLVLALGLSGVSGVLYGTNFLGSSDHEAGVAGTPDGRGTGGATGDDETSGSETGGRGARDGGGGAREGLVPGGVNPAFEEMIGAWRSSDLDVPLLVPTYTPFAVDGVSVDPFGTGSQNYYVWSDSDNQFANHIRVEIQDAVFPAESMATDTILIDGREYPYTEDTTSLTGGTEPPEGQYTVLLWVYAEGGGEYWYYVEMNTMWSPVPSEEFVKTIVAMEVLDP